MGLSLSRWRKTVRNRWDDALSRVDWRDFERLLADHYRRQGYRVEHCGTGENGAQYDGGIDLKLYRDNEYLVVQCKHWNALQVTHKEMHEIAGIMLSEGATGAVLVTSGEFTPYARTSAAKIGKMQLIDGNALRAMLGHIPEPKGIAHAADDRAARIMADVGERVFNAAEARVRRGVRRGAKTAATNFIWIPLAKFGLFIATVWFIVTILTTTLDRVTTSLTASANGKVQPTPMVSAPPPAPPPPQPAVRPAVNANVIYAPAPPPLTETEIREQQRLADEAMRVLAPHTPELDMGYPDDAHSNRYRAPESGPDASAGWAR